MAGMKIYGVVSERIRQTMTPNSTFQNGVQLKTKTVLILDCILLVVVITALVLSTNSCATTGWRANCSDDSITAAEIYSRRTGKPTFIAVSRSGDHAQAFTINSKNGATVWLHVFPFFQWGVYPSKQDDMIVGRIWTLEEFIRGHRWREK